MATTSKTLTTSWQLVVPVAHDWCLISTRTKPELVEFATTADDSTLPASDLDGHVINVFDGVTRHSLAVGSIYARLASRSKTGHTVKIVVDSGSTS